MTKDVLVVIPNRVTLDALRVALEASERFGVVNGADHPDAALSKFSRNQPDVLVWDRAYLMHGSVLMGLMEDFPTTVLVISGVDPLADDLGACSALGARGYLSLSASLEQWVACTVGATTGEIPDPQIAARLNTALRKLARAHIARRPPIAVNRRGSDDLLTPREQEVYELICAKLPNKEIARRLAIEETTVKQHVNKVLRKKGVARRIELIGSRT